MEKSPEASQNRRLKVINRTTLIGSAGNLGLTAFKFVAAIFGHSAAMLADAVHSLSDFITDIIVIIFVRISNKPKDHDHEYGHGKFETLATAIIGLMLMAVGIGICYNGIYDIVSVVRGAELERPGWIALIAAVASIAIKELLFQYTVKVGRRIESPVVIANAWHHRSDAYSSVAATVGIAGAMLLGPKWRVLDPIAAVFVSIFIIKVSFELIRPCFDELMDKSLPPEIEKEIMKTINSFPEISSPHNLRTRRVGQINVIDIHVRMDPSMTVKQSHDITVSAEHQLREFLGPAAIINIHVEPVKPT